MIMYPCSSTPRFFFLKDPPPTEFYPLPLHDALPICLRVLAIVLADDRHGALPGGHVPARGGAVIGGGVLVKGLEPDAGGFRDAHVLADERDEHLRSEEHTSELQSQSNLVCRLLLEKK